ncbi:MAG TPA: alkaline phosphatase family protein, partial [Thermoplasmata archaeon]
MLRSPWTPIGLAVLTFLLASPAGVTISKLPSPLWAGAPGSSHFQIAWAPGSTHLNHIITVVMENRVYDNYFGEYCPTLGPYCSSTGNGIPGDACIPKLPSDPSLGCVAPFNLTTAQFATSDMPHTWASGLTAWDHGAMDGFYQAEGTDGQPLGHYNGSTLPIYWDLAEQYAISDNLFAANLSYSLPNHWYLLAGQAPNVTQTSLLETPEERALYLNQSNATATVQDLLNRTSVSWKYYDYGLPTWTTATQSGGSAFDFWNPMGARSESYTPSYVSHFAPRTEFLSDAANGTLPQISWVIPGASVSDHPGWNVTAGESWVAQLVNAVEGS